MKTPTRPRTERPASGRAVPGAPVVLAGVGHDFPGEPVGNDYFENLPGLDVDDAWIRRHTGVATRHWVPEDQRPVDPAERAARQALRDAGLEPGDVDVIIGTSATARPRVNPTSPGNRYMDVALPVQRRLHAVNAFCLDVTGVACAGFLNASAVAKGLLAATSTRTALVVCAENPRPILNFSYRNCVLFGGGAAAGVWRVSADGTDGIQALALHSDASYYDAFDIDDQDKMVMKGKVVGDTAPPLLRKVTDEALTRSGLGLDDIDWVIPHQGNINLIRDVAGLLGLPEDRTLLNIGRRGNTSSVSVPGCLSEYVHDGTIRRGDRVLSMAIGRGFSTGAMVFSYGSPRHRTRGTAAPAPQPSGDEHP
ncbi:ketoacyl-ACP synthase III [Streptomyces sp. TRM 70361]|uniref:3-oxoacyl-ACP synthase III family protein n=1 Tax=Streptomyces sp. TRM 70361 TaxID=3116553 RepID=UPI002E7B9502|nr:ketoacyl-ACP synthase III [Streptomyces sp. TRM 70361]MEE1942791.1 ketoacyl-ACP synthase III [Streptomyces sp. TRM 70361]